MNPDSLELEKGDCGRFVEVVKFVLLPEGKAPTKNLAEDAAWDLYAAEDAVILGGERKTIKAGVCLEIPKGHVGLIWPRSGLSVKSGIDVLAGVIDPGYRGEIKVCLLNTQLPLPLFETPRDVALEVKKGDKIAQILFHRLPEIKMVEATKLSDSERGDKGFGSSGR